MKRTRRTALALAGTTLVGVGIFAPNLAGALPIATPEDPNPPPPVVTTRRPTTTTTRRNLVDPNARYVVQADWFFCDSETGRENWTGSDEPRFEFVGTDEMGNQTVRTKSFSDVDTGESRFFGPMDLSAPMAGPFTLSVSAQEVDWGTPNELIGHTTLTWSPDELATGTPTVGSTSTEKVVFTGDDSHYTLYLRTKRVA